jgi:predicted nucleotidyltransferase
MHQGRYLLYGSAARGGMRYHSDVDILLDFPPDQQRAAWNFAEGCCAELGVDPDIMPLAWCRDDFLDHIRPDLVSLP